MIQFALFQQKTVIGLDSCVITYKHKLYLYPVSNSYKNMLFHGAVSNLDLKCNSVGFNRILLNAERACFSSKPCTMSRNIHVYQKCFSRWATLLFNLYIFRGGQYECETNHNTIGILRKEHILPASVSNSSVLIGSTVDWDGFSLNKISGSLRKYERKLPHLTDHP